MFHWWNGRPSKSYLSLVLHGSAVVLLLTHYCGGQHQMVGPSEPMLAMVGADIILPCHLEPETDVVTKTVEWARQDLNPRLVHVMRGGVELLVYQNPLFAGRTSLSTNKLKRGDMSLKLSRVRLTDAGTYRCLIPSLGSSEVKLAVGALSSSVVIVAETDKALSRVVLQCRSEGWYPEPEVVWLDGEGNPLLDGPTKTTRGPGDLYTVSSRVTVEKTPNNRFTCRVHQKKINQTRETQIHIRADVFMNEISSAVRISISLVVCFTAVAAVLFMMWKWGQKKTVHTETTDNRFELQRLLDGDRDRMMGMTESEKMKYLDRTKVKLEEDSERNEREIKHVEHVITTLKNQKTELKKQRDTLISIAQGEKVEIEEWRKKTKNNPKIDKGKKKKKYEETIETLEKRQEQHKTLIEDTDNLLESTEELIIATTGKKAALQRDKEQIEKHLQEVEKQRGETEETLQETNDPA